MIPADDEDEWIEPEPDRYQEWADQELSKNWDADKALETKRLIELTRQAA